MTTTKHVCVWCRRPMKSADRSACESCRRDRLRAAGMDGWDAIPDPEAHLRAVTGCGECAAKEEEVQRLEAQNLILRSFAYAGPGWPPPKVVRAALEKAAKDGDSSLHEVAALTVKRLAHALRVMLAVETEPCQYDHNDFCQAHYSSKPCRVEQARKAMGEKP